MTLSYNIDQFCDRLNSKTGRYRGCAVRFKNVRKMRHLYDRPRDDLFEGACPNCFNLNKLAGFDFEDLATEWNQPRKFP